MLTDQKVLKAVVEQVERDWLSALDEPSSVKERIQAQLRAARPRKFEDGTWDIAIPCLGELIPPRTVDVQWTDLTVRLVPDETFPGDMNAGKEVLQLDRTIADTMRSAPAENVDSGT